MNIRIRNSRNPIAVFLMAVYFFALFSGMFHRHSTTGAASVPEIAKGKWLDQGHSSCVACHFNASFFTTAGNSNFDFTAKEFATATTAEDLYRSPFCKAEACFISPRGPPLLNS